MLLAQLDLSGISEWAQLGGTVLLAVAGLVYLSKRDARDREERAASMEREVATHAEFATRMEALGSACHLQSKEVADAHNDALRFLADQFATNQQRHMEQEVRLTTAIERLAGEVNSMRAQLGPN